MSKYIPYFWGATLAALIMAGCQQDAAISPDVQDLDGDEIVLESEFGPYTPTNEAPGFGDVDLLSSAAAESDAGDPFAADAEVARALNGGAGVPAYVLRITWGMLAGDSTVTEGTDWSGYAQVSNGVLAVLKTVRFEPGDYLVRPRESRQRLDFVSRTSVHFDGLALVIVNNDSQNTDGLFTINAGAYSRSFSFSELDSLDLIEAVGDAGNEASIVSRRKDVQPIGGGFFTGRWQRRAENSGQFQGRWISADGETTGHIKGLWGRNRRGVKVLAGKIIDNDGVFAGLLAGEWGFDGLRRNNGWLAGRWVNAQYETSGRFRGHWHAGRPGDGRGFLHGRWIENSDGSAK